MNMCMITGFGSFLVIKILKNGIFAAYLDGKGGQNVALLTYPLIIVLECCNYTNQPIFMKLLKNDPHSMCLLAFP